MKVVKNKSVNNVTKDLFMQLNTLSLINFSKINSVTLSEIVRRTLNVSCLVQVNSKLRFLIRS